MKNKTKALKCTICKKCNHKGLPSVQKHSAYCELMRGTISEKRVTMIGLIKQRFIWARTRGDMEHEGK